MKKNLESIITKSQKKKFEKQINFEGAPHRMIVTVRYDDECGNGHNSFSITGEIWKIGRTKDCEICGCIHNEIEKFFPELSHLIKWHLFDSTGPMHYIANTLYHASNRDCHGLLKGESRQLIDRKTGLPAFKLQAIDTRTGQEVETYKLENYIDAENTPECPYILKYVPWCRVGEGKTPDLEAARASSLWFDAELEDFTKENLEKRLPDLIKEFRKTIESLGFIF